MAFALSGLYQLSPGGNPGGSRLWSYNTADTQAAVNTAGYFNEAHNVLDIGDAILVKVVGGTPRTPTSVTAMTMSIVNGKASGVIDIVDGTAIGFTDTD